MLSTTYKLATFSVGGVAHCMTMLSFFLLFSLYSIRQLREWQEHREREWGKTYSEGLPPDAKLQLRPQPLTWVASSNSWTMKEPISAPLISVNVAPPGVRATCALSGVDIDSTVMKCQFSNHYFYMRSERTILYRSVSSVSHTFIYLGRSATISTSATTNWFSIFGALHPSVNYMIIYSYTLDGGVVFGPPEKTDEGGLFSAVGLTVTSSAKKSNQNHDSFIVPQTWKCACHTSQRTEFYKEKKKKQQQQNKTIWWKR